jgi:hypothetical protein
MDLSVGAATTWLMARWGSEATLETGTWAAEEPIGFARRALGLEEADRPCREEVKRDAALDGPDSRGASGLAFQHVLVNDNGLR